jgi:serine/threonine protein phosphatase PrpC
MWIANVGDSRAVVCERGSAKQLTVDHEPHETNERQRIEKHGGFVTTFPGTIFSCVTRFIIVVNNKMQLPYYVLWFVCR